MASIRRTLSPARHHRDRFSVSSPPSSPLRSASGTPRLSHFAAAAASPSPWRRPFFRFLLFFFFGLFLGLFPSADLADPALRRHHFALRPDRKLEFDAVRSEPLLSVELAEKSSAAGARSGDPEKLILIVTPTYGHALQAYYLHRLAHTLRLVPPPLLWIVVGDGATSAETAGILRRTGMAYRHLFCESGSSEVKDRAVHQRNAALDHIEHHRLEGIVYFADEDNVHSLELFDSIREIRNFGTWPIAMLAQNKNKMTLEGSVCNGNRVIGWHINENSKRPRRFHVDVSGFAFNSTMLWDPNKRVHQSWNAIRQLVTVEEGLQTTTFIEQLVEDESQMEGLPADCSKIINWCLRLEATDIVYPKEWQVSRNLDAVVPLT